MEHSHSTVSESGQLVLSPEAKAALGVPSGGEIEVILRDQTVELRQKKKPMSDEEIKRRIDELQTLFARQPGEPSLEDNLYRMRREEEEHSRRKYGC